MGQAVQEGLDLPGLETFFREHVPDYRGTLTAELMHGGRSNLTFRLSDGTTDWILRRPPLGELTPSAHDMQREHRVVSALAGSGVPVATAVAYGDDAILGVPFSLVEFVTGAVIRTEEQLHELSDATIEACAYSLIDVLARLHAVEPLSVGLEGFGRPSGYLERQIARWNDQWSRVSTRELADLTMLVKRLTDECRPDSASSIVHGDFRIDNAILNPEDLTEVRAIVDWEMSTLGDPLADLGLHLAYSDPVFAPVLAGSAASTSTRLPSRTSVAEHYARCSGRDLANLSFYLGLGYFKIAVIAEGIHGRYLKGLTRGSGFESVGEAVAPLVASGLSALQGSL